MKNSPKKNSIDLTRKYTYGDYCKWDDDERWELIDGEPYCMSAPTRTHSLISGEVFRQLANFFHRKPCEVHYAPFDVRLPKGEEVDEEIDTVVQPDIVVIWDSSKLDEKGCRGAPELAIEILSPSTSSRDKVKKLNLFERQKVREYWIIDPNGDLMVFLLQRNGRYGRPQTYDRSSKVSSSQFPGLEIDLEEVFPKAPKPEVREPARKYSRKK